MKLIGLFLIAMIGFAFATTAFAQNNIREVFACNFNDGQDMNDLMSARDFYLEQAAKAGIDVPIAFIWTPFKGATKPFDLLWFNDHTDLTAFAMATDANVASPEMAAVLDRFDSVVDCYSSIYSRTMIYKSGEALVKAPSAFIDSYECHFTSGKGRSDLDDLWERLGTGLNELGTFTETIIYTSMPITSGPQSADLYINGVYANASAWAAGQASLANTETGQALGRYVSSVLDCDMALLHSQRVVNATP